MPATMINGTDPDLRIESLLKAYKAIDHEDHTKVILLALYTHAPTPEGKAYVRGEILKHEGDQLGMKSLADGILRKLLLPVIALGTKAHVSPSARTEIKQLSLSRDNYRCVVSKAVELAYFYTPETVEWNPGDQWLPTYASHVIPLAKSTKSSSWQALERFAGFRLEELYGDRISNLTNIITLSYDIHSAFCRFLVWFELDKKNPKPNVYRFRKQLHTLPGPPDGTIVRLSTTDPDLPMPHVKYILLHAALAKVLRDSDMGRWVDGMLREYERLENLASDGSHADVLASGLHATGLTSNSNLSTPIEDHKNIWPEYFEFALDGTLIDSTPGVLGAWDQFGKDYPFLNVKKIIETSHGVRSIDTLRRWLRLDSEEKLNQEVTRFESEVIRHGLVLLPGVQDILDTLKEGQTEEHPGWTIVTSATRWYAPQALQSVGIPLPKHMVMAEDVERGKPNPDPYLQGAKNCKVDPKNCLVVEDAISGMRAGRAAGAKVLGVCTSGSRSTVEKGEPDYIVDNLTKYICKHCDQPYFEGSVQHTWDYDTHHHAHINTPDGAPIQAWTDPNLGRLFLPNTIKPMFLSSRLTYKDWGDDEGDEVMSAVKWLSPEPNAVLVSGDKLVATWSTPARPIFSPSFQLCLVETEECGDTVWPKVKKLPNGQYTITLKIPQLGSDNNFFVRMVDDKGSNYDTPEFKLQGSGPPRSALALNSGSSSSSSVLPDSLAPILPDSGSSDSIKSGAGHERLSENGSNGSGSSGSNSSLSKSNEEIKGSPQNSNEGTDRTAFKNAGKGWASQANGTSTMSVSGNSTTVPATTAISSLALTPSITNNALIGNSNDNKPSTAAIVVPLAIFAAALAGLLFSLRQRSKAKEIQGPNNEPALNQVTSGDLSTGGSSKSIAGSSPTDLERAMEFIAVIRASQSPQLTPLPPSIESRWRERRKNRMQQSDASFRTEVSSNHTSIPASLSMPDMNQQIRPHNGPLPPIPSVVELDPTDMCPQHEIPRSGTYPTVPSHTSGLSRTAAHQVLASALAAEPAHSPTHPFGLIPGSHPDLAQAIPAIPTTRLPASLSFAGMPRPPCFVQPPAPAIPLSISQPSITTDLIHHSTSATSAPALNSTLSPLFVLPDSLRAALPRPLTASVPEIVISTSHSRCLEPQAQPQLEYKPAEQSPTRPRPAIPYSTRPRARDPQVTAVPNPYEAIAKALRTPRLV